MAKPVSRDDVARRAGTSTAVVSYVVNNGPRNVAPATRAKVVRAIEELNYRPNGMARALRSRRSRTIGLIIPDNCNPFFAELAKAVEDAAFERGYVLLVGNAGEDAEREARYVSSFLEHRVEGLLFIGVGASAHHQELSQAAIPLVVLDRLEPSLHAPSVVVDNVGGARAATEHLLGHGYRSVGCIAGPDDVPSSQERRAGWTQALDKAGVPKRGRVVVGMPFTREGGYQAARTILGRRTRPRALFISSDQQAIGALRAAAELGVSIPNDLALFGFDDIEEAAFTHPPLSTVRQPIASIARTAVDLIAVVNRPAAPVTTLPFELNVRSSCGC